MFDKSFATHILGLELDRSSIKGVALTCSSHSIKLDSYFELPLEQTEQADPNVKPLYIADKQLLQRMKKALVVTAMPTQDVLMRPLSLKVKKEKDIDSILPFQAEPLLPYPVENAVLDRLLLSKDKEGADVAFFAVRKDHLAEEIKRWNALEIDPEVITAAPVALALFAKNFAKSETPYFVLYLGYTQAFCLLIDEGKLLAAQALPVKMESLAIALAEDEDLPLADTRVKLADPGFVFPPLEDHPFLENALETMRTSLSRITLALGKQLKGREAGSLLMLGDLPTGLKEQFSAALNKPLLQLTPPPEFKMEERDLERFALCIGEALSARPGTQEQINFRQQEFQFPDRWKRLKQPVLIYLLLCIGIALALFIYSKAEVGYEEGQVRLHYLELLQIMNKPYEQFERQYLSKFSTDKEAASGELHDVAALSTEELKKRLSYLEKELQATPQVYPLQPNTPLVSDLLAWIATHASFKGKDGEAGLQIESLNYTIVKRPEPSKKQEKYQVKVELEFSSPTPKMAREFHDALIAPNDIVDPKGEIKWNSSHDHYRTSFYLKDKTVYPNP